MVDILKALARRLPEHGLETIQSIPDTDLRNLKVIYGRRDKDGPD
jgi:hypothetical protein